MSFSLSTGNTVYPSASASISSNGDTSATVKVTASCYLGNGWVQSTGVVARIYINGSLVSTQTILGNGTYYSSSSGTKSVSASSSISKTTSSKSVSWSVQFWQYTDGTAQSNKQTISGSTTISAKTSYTVSYNANGGSGAPSSQTKWYGTTLTLSSTKPTRTGYSFQNWNTNSGGTGTSYASGASYTVNAAVTLYAQWKANTYTVSYNANGGSGAPSSQTKTYGVNLTLSSTKPTRTNYNFLGWGTSASATTVSYAPGATYSANSAITLYAVWELAYWKPKLTNLSVTRCTSDGTADNFGTYALVKFNWELCQLLGTNEISSIAIVCNSVTTTVSASGTSGSVSQVVGAGALSIESSYTVEVTVTDTIQSGSTSNTKTIASSSFPIDFLAGGKGVAFGKPAETANTVDSNWMMHVSYGDIGFMQTHSTSGNVVGLGVGVSGTNRGIWMENAGGSSNWLLYTNGTNDTVYNGFNPDGNVRGLVRLNNSNNLHFGYGSYDNSEGQVFYNGNKVTIRSKSGIYITDTTSGLSSRAYGVNNVLWSGVYYMNTSQTATLSEAVSKQPNGIVLVWSRYTPSSQTVSNWEMVTFFVPKYLVANNLTTGYLCEHRAPGYPMAKYVAISNTTIAGAGSNNDSLYSTNNEDFFNNYNVLRYVIGV